MNISHMTFNDVLLFALVFKSKKSKNDLFKPNHYISVRNIVLKSNNILLFIP